MLKRIPLVAALVLSAVLAACGGDPNSEPKSGAPSTAKPAIPERFWLPAAPAAARSIIELHDQCKDGEDVVAVGKLGGAAEVFNANRAIFTLVDGSLKDCSDMQDTCKTPWDYCCEEPKSLAHASALVELQEGGRIIAANARGFHGLDHSKRVTVSGKLKKDAQGNVSIIASGLHVD